MLAKTLKRINRRTASTRMLPITTLDYVLKERTSSEALSLKLDVQGFELEILHGANQTLGKTEAEDGAGSWIRSRGHR
jgi:FkbM family methyltransferase